MHKYQPRVHVVEVKLEKSSQFKNILRFQKARPSKATRCAESTFMAAAIRPRHSRFGRRNSLQSQRTRTRQSRSWKSTEIRSRKDSETTAETRKCTMLTSKVGNQFQVNYPFDQIFGQNFRYYQNFTFGQNFSFSPKFLFRQKSHFRSIKKILTFSILAILKFSQKFLNFFIHCQIMKTNWKLIQVRTQLTWPGENEWASKAALRQLLRTLLHLQRHGVILSRRSRVIPSTLFLTRSTTLLTPRSRKSADTFRLIRLMQPLRYINLQKKSKLIFWKKQIKFFLNIFF